MTSPLAGVGQVSGQTWMVEEIRLIASNLPSAPSPSVPPLQESSPLRPESTSSLAERGDLERWGDGRVKQRGSDTPGGRLSWVEVRLTRAREPQRPAGRLNGTGQRRVTKLPNHEAPNDPKETSGAQTANGPGPTHAVRVVVVPYRSRASSWASASDRASTNCSLLSWSSSLVA
jgi:hypothetical protein